MNKDFWDAIAKLWCKTSTEADLKHIAETASAQAQEDQKNTSGYSLNPLDDEEDDDFI